MTLEIQTLEKKILEKDNFPYTSVTVETVGQFLHGQNAFLAKEPFSVEFLTDVAYNSPASMRCILWLQLNKLQNCSSEQIL
jgi:hypothetical protein